VNIKTYYYRLKRLRLIALGDTETNIQRRPVITEGYPVFAELTLPESSQPEAVSENMCALAVTIKAGRMMISIHNGAEAAVIANVIKAANEIS